MITGFRWDARGAQAVYGIRPDLSTFGKGLGNGFSVAALVGRRDLMELGGLRDERERVFLLSTTHGAETHGLAVALEVMRLYREEGIVERLYDRGDRLRAALDAVIVGQGLERHILLLGRSPEHRLRDARRGRSALPVIPDAVPAGDDRAGRHRAVVRGECRALGRATSTERARPSHGALSVYRRALDDGVDRYLRGRPVKPVFRPYA